jgi:transketolase
VDEALATRRSSELPEFRAVTPHSTKATRFPPDTTSAEHLSTEPISTGARNETFISALDEKTLRPSTNVTAAAPIDESQKAATKPPCMIPAGLANRSSARISHTQRPGTDLSTHTMPNVRSLFGGTCIRETIAREATSALRDIGLCMAAPPAPPAASAPPNTVVQDPALVELGINVVRGLAMDAPQAANSGHSGTAMALAPLAHVLWTRIMRYDPRDPHWPDRDRFVLSNGHASILQYAFLHLTGYDLSLNDIKQFRQWGSRTPGHPEHLDTAGIEVTTGPLGQGTGNAVGLAIAERTLRARFGAEVCDHHTFVIAGDGCFMEGISHEAASLAGHLRLGRLIAFYDDNHITIDGPTELAYDDDVPKRFEAYGWRVHNLGERANDVDALEAAVRDALDGAAGDPAAPPTLLVLRSHIGWPSPKLTDTAAAHGNPFGDEEIAVTKKLLGLPPNETFWVPDEVRNFYGRQVARGAEAHAEWQARFDAWDGDKVAWEAAQSGRGLPGWDDHLPAFEAGTKLATRHAINQCINASAAKLPGLMAGSADLTGNNGVLLKDAQRQDVTTPGGAQLHYGIREHAMGAVMTGLALHGGILPVGGTFFVFSDYMRPAVRLAALSQAHVIYSWTHDSIGLGEDGPTHQPIEHLASLRAMPGLTVVRPADANETVQAWKAAVEGDGPIALCLTRQDVPVLAETVTRAAEGLRRGGYVLADPPAGAPAEIVLVGTGSEVQHCLAAAATLAADPDDPIAARVVSLPCWEWFEAQDDSYLDEVLPPELPVLSIEAGSTFGWERYADDSIGLDRFGASAPAAVAMEKFGFTADHVVQRARALLASLGE